MLTTQGSILEKDLDDLQLKNLINEGKNKDVVLKKQSNKINSQSKYYT